MQNYQANIEDLSKCTVAIQETGENGRILGTGVIVTDDGIILTCYHVIRNKQSKKLVNEKNFNIYFPDIKEIEPAQIIEEYCNPSLDIAFLQLQEKKLLNQAKVSQLSESIYFGNLFASIGFRKPETFDSLTSRGEVRRITNTKSKQDGEELTKPMLQIYSDEIEQGMSGAPVLDLETNRVIGIISEHWISTGSVDRRLNFAIPIESAIQVYSNLKEKNSGLKQNTTYEKVNDSYYKHSQEISQMIYEGWCNMNIFCSCKYEDGRIERTNPEEPELKDIALARQHFQTGYEGLWQIKEKAKSESIEICSKIEQVFNSFKEIVYNELEKDFSYNNSKLGKLNRVGVTSFPSNRDDRVYIDMHVIDTIFSRIVYKERIQISEPQSTLIPIPEKNTDFTITQLNIPKGIIGYGDSLSMNILKSRLESLSSNATIHSLLNEYILLQQCLEGNTKINKTWNEVQKIWKDVYHESQIIKGYCKRCLLINS